MFWASMNCNLVCLGAKRFKWLLENGLGYAGWLVDNMRNETATTAPLSKNKHAFKKYITSFKEGQSVVQLKAKERTKKSTPMPSQCKFFFTCYKITWYKCCESCKWKVNSFVCLSIYSSKHFTVYQKPSCPCCQFKKKVFSCLSKYDHVCHQKVIMIQFLFIIKHL